jgi:hypothetical protein
MQPRSREALRRRATHLGVATVLALYGCSQSESNSLPELTTTGESISDLAGSDSTIVVFYDPADCMQCDPYMPSWIQLSASSPERIIMFLAREPTGEEASQINLLGYRFDGSVASMRPDGSWAALYVDGEVRHSERLQPGNRLSGLAKVWLGGSD